ncbi:MAG TPA: type II secretion system F family protein [Bryobacteraceae bacterium]|nr:type II secretion system F family protein [Bryobacteraceae bacterium]
MEIVIAILLFSLLMGAITFYGYRRYARPGRVFERLGAPVLEAEVLGAGTLSQTPEVGWIVRVIQQVGEKVPISPDDAGVTRRDLIMAGYRSEAAIKVFNGIKITLCILLVIVGFSMRSAMPNPVLRIVLIAFSGFMGFYLPGYMLDKKIAKRQTTIRLALPDALDMLVVSIEAGLGLDQAIQHVGRELQLSHKELSEELSLVNLEMRAGKRRSEALKNLAERTGEAELQKLVAILIQSDRFGTSMGDSLRSHSDFLRVRRRQEAEERAGKVGVKLVFPIFFFILPSMLIVAAGPGLLQVFKYLFPLMKQFQG